MDIRNQLLILKAHSTFFVILAMEGIQNVGWAKRSVPNE